MTWSLVYSGVSKVKLVPLHASNVADLTPPARSLLSLALLVRFAPLAAYRVTGRRVGETSSV